MSTTPEHRRYFPADFAAKLVEVAGNPYRPSNGTEGMYWEDAWCSDCKHADKCDVMLNMFCFQIDEPDYPGKIVVYGVDGYPTCRAHELQEPSDDAKPARQLRSCEGQRELFAPADLSEAGREGELMQARLEIDEPPEGKGCFAIHYGAME